MPCWPLTGHYPPKAPETCIIIHTPNLPATSTVLYDQIKQEHLVLASNASGRVYSELTPHLISHEYIRPVLMFEIVLSSTTFIHWSPIYEISPSRWALALTVIFSQQVIFQSWYGSWVLSCLQRHHRHVWMSNSLW